MKILAAFLLLLGIAVAQQHSPEYRSAERKLAAMDAYDANPAAAGLLTTLTDAEMNAYFAEGGIKWGDGVSNVRISTAPSTVHASAQIDFDKVTAKARSSNPLLGIFTGIHTVRITAQAAALHGRGSVKVQSVSLDGTEIPPAVLELFIVKFLQPKYPEADLDAVFGMPNRIDSATVGDHQITFAQR
ncbi:MAG TPA: hypothetical protein VGL89_03475 [Candidatus Koribacter sp.]|jgi:hypothetical protein